MPLPPLLPARPGEAQHQRAARSLREAVAGGLLPPGTRLSRRALAGAWGMGRGTLEDATLQLQAEGYLEVRAQSGTYVAGGVRGRPAPRPPELPLSEWARRALSEQPAAAGSPYPLDFRLGQPGGMFSSERWAQALARRAQDAGRQFQGGALPDPLGPAETRAALAAWLSRERGASVTPEMVLLTGGTQSALDLLGRTFLEPGRVAVIEDPAYPGARRAFAASGARLHPARVDRLGLRPEGLPAQAALAYVTPGCQFPTTATLDAGRRAALLAWAAGTGALIVEDDYAADLHHAARPPTPLQALAPGQVVLLGTFSQSLAPALRSGYLLGPPALVSVLARTRPLTDRHPPTLDALALAGFLEGGGYARHLRRVRAQLAHRQDVLLGALAHELPRLSPVPAAAGQHLLLPLPPGTDERAFQRAAAAAGVGLNVLSEYRVGGDETRPAALLAFAPLAPELLREGARRLAEVLRAEVLGTLG